MMRFIESFRNGNGVQAYQRCGWAYIYHNSNGKNAVID